MRYLTMLLVLALAGCSTAAPDLAKAKADFAAFTAKDGQRALDIAIAGNDKPAIQCLSWLVPKLKGLETNPSPNPELLGPLAALETVRVAVNSANTGTTVLADLDLNCAALRSSIERDIARGALLAAGASSGVGAAPAAAAAVGPLLNLLRAGGGL